MSLENYTKIDYLIQDETYKVIEDQVTCPICCELKINPKMCTACQNTFCGKCAGTLNKCPFKCENFKCIDSRLTLDLLTKLTFNCMNNCGEKIKFDNLKNHYDYDCKKIDFKEKYEKSQQKIAELTKQIKNLEIENKDVLVKSLSLQNIIDRNNQNSIREEENSAKIKRAPGLKEVKSSFHIHKLIYKDNDYDCLCDICHKPFPKYSSFCCKKCQFDLCENCIDYPNNPIVFNKTLHSHPVIYFNNKNIRCQKCSRTTYSGYSCEKCKINYCEVCHNKACYIF